MSTPFAELKALTLRHADGARSETAIRGVAIGTACDPTVPTVGIYQPMACLVLQGAKQVMIGDRLLRYDPASYFVASLDLPAVGWVVEASRESPYLALSLRIDPETLAALIVDAPPSREAAAPGFAVSPLAPDIVDAWLRLMRLLDSPRDIPVLAPLIERELLYRLLQGPQGGVLHQIARADSRLSQVRRAVGWIRENYDKPLRIGALAQSAGMSVASFHRHFKAATAMSPLQYQKQLRLQQARRLLIADEEASRAGYAVGYESASQFSREYARLFGAPPARDAARMRSDATEVSARFDEAAA